MPITVFISFGNDQLKRLSAFFFRNDVPPFMVRWQTLHGSHDLRNLCRPVNIIPSSASTCDSFKMIARGGGRFHHDPSGCNLRQGVHVFFLPFQLIVFCFFFSRITRRSPLFLLLHLGARRRTRHFIKVALLSFLIAVPVCETSAQFEPFRYPCRKQRLFKSS